MIEWFTWVIVAVAAAAGILCLVRGLAKRAPDDFSLGATLLVEALLLVQVVVAIVAPFVDNHPTGDSLEFWAYLITALIMLPLAGLWALIERNRWSTIVLAIANLAVSIMVYRMFIIWTVQGH